MVVSFELLSPRTRRIRGTGSTAKGDLCREGKVKGALAGDPYFEVGVRMVTVNHS